jgi:preprotein translocase subunit SecB
LKSALVKLLGTRWSPLPRVPGISNQSPQDASKSGININNLFMFLVPPPKNRKAVFRLPRKGEVNFIRLGVEIFPNRAILTIISKINTQNKEPSKMSELKLITQFLKDMSFESPNVPQLFFKQENSQAKMEINMDIQIKGAENNLYMVDLVSKVHSKLESDDKTIFRIDVVYSGLVSAKFPKEEDLQKALLVDIPTMLFPSVRALVLRATGDSGFPPFAMTPVDFEQLYKDRKKAKK